jgi:hypothetical protein
MSQQEEPMDFGERLAQKIHADVERKIEAGLAGESVGASKALGGIALCGLVTLVALVAVVVAIVLLVKLLA